MTRGVGPSASGQLVGMPVVNTSWNACAATLPARLVTVDETTNSNEENPGSGTDGTSRAHHPSPQLATVAASGDPFTGLICTPAARLLSSTGSLKIATSESCTATLSAPFVGMVRMTLGCDAAGTTP